MEQRIPCLDEMCVGTVGEDGKCRYCGKPGPGGAAAEPVEDSEQDEGESEVEPDSDDITPESEAEAEAEAEADEDEDEDEYVPFGDDRKPCVDEMCTGTIGDDGKCRYCGKESPPD